MQEKKINIAAIGAQYGVLAGIGCIILTMILYIIDLSLVLGFWIFSGYVIIVGCKILTAQTIRKAQSNYISFKDGLKGTFMVSVISLLIWIIFNSILFIYIDPQLVELSKEKAMERTEWLMNKSGASNDVIEDAMDKAEQQDYEPNIKTSLINYASSLIVGFLYATIISGIFYLITKDNTPDLQPITAN